MTPEAIIGLVVCSWTALIMIVIGVVQLKSREPVGFYTGIEPPKKEELTDVAAWNRKHGMMWLAFGGVIILSWLAGLFLGDLAESSLLAVVDVGILVAFIIFMIWYHHRLVKKYIKKNIK